jgi:hypothetical protein
MPFIGYIVALIIYFKFRKFFIGEKYSKRKWPASFKAGVSSILFLLLWNVIIILLVAYLTTH